MPRKANRLTKLLKELSRKKVNNYGQDFLQTWDKSQDEIEATVLVAEILLEMWQQNISPRIYDSGLAVSWFRDKSTRTRFSFKSAADLLGLAVQDLDEEKSQISHGETTRETTNMISFLTEVIGIRDDKFLGFGHSFQKQVANTAQEGFKDNILPQRPSVINLQCDRDHPTQSLSDLTHLKTYFGGDFKNLKGKKIAMTWAYSPSYGKPMSVAQGVVTLMSRFGMNVVLAYPKGYHIIPEIEKTALSFAKISGGSFTTTNNMKQAFKDADIVYPKSWASYKAMQRRAKLYQKGSSKTQMNKLEKAELRENAKHKNWECTEAMMKITRQGKGLYLHCLPADVSGLSCRQGEVTASVFNRHRINTFKQAGYKPYVIGAMMLLTKFKNPTQLLRKLIRPKTPRIST